MQYETDETLLTKADDGIRPGIPTLQVIHTNEAGPFAPGRNPGSVMDLLAFCANVNNRASYNVIVDRTGRSGRSNDDNYIPWSAGETANRKGIHICAMGWAQQSRDEWLSFPNQIHTIARILAWNSALYDIPLVAVSPADILKERHGVCGHGDVAKAWRETSHTDPGPNFPMDVVLTIAQQINDPTQQDWIDTMANVTSLIDGKVFSPEQMLAFIDMHSNKSYNLLVETNKKLERIATALEKK